MEKESAGESEVDDKEREGMLYIVVSLTTEKTRGSRWVSWPWTGRVTAHSLGLEKRSQ